MFSTVKLESSNKVSHLLFVLMGIVSALTRSQDNNAGATFPLYLIILEAIILGGIFGWIGYYVYCLLIELTGEWLDGKARKQELSIVLSYAQIPFITSLAFFVFGIVAFENKFFISSITRENYTEFAVVLNNSFRYAQYALSAWTLILMVIGISTVKNLVSENQS